MLTRVLMMSLGLFARKAATVIGEYEPYKMNARRTWSCVNGIWLPVRITEVLPHCPVYSHTVNERDGDVLVNATKTPDPA